MVTLSHWSGPSSIWTDSLEKGGGRASLQPLASLSLYPGRADGDLALCPAYLFTDPLIKFRGLVILDLLTLVLSYSAWSARGLGWPLGVFPLTRFSSGWGWWTVVGLKHSGGSRLVVST